jgi:hypothetical protein
MSSPVAIKDIFKQGLRNNFGGRDREFLFFDFHGLDNDVWDDHFMGAATDVRYGSTANGTSAAALVTDSKLGGQGLLNAGTADEGRSDLSLGLHFRADRSCAVAVKLSMSAITQAKLEVGFTDVVTGTDAGAVNVLATPSFNANNFVGIVFDTDDTAYYQLAGVDNTVEATKVEDTVAPVVDTFEWLILETREYDTSLNIAAARFHRATAEGYFTYSSAWMRGAVASNVLLTPWIFAQNRGASTNLDVSIDRLVVWQHSS